jgi:hypothetical protein
VLDGDGGGEGQRAVGHAAHVGETENDYAEEEDGDEEEANSVVCAALSQSADWDDVSYRFLASCSPTEAVRHRHMESTTRSSTRG